jgi:hypothetical protein
MPMLTGIASPARRQFHPDRVELAPTGIGDFTS